MEPLDCRICEAHVVPPPIDLDGLGLALRQCACCKALLSWDAFAAGSARAEDRRCVACVNGPAHVPIGTAPMLLQHRWSLTSVSSRRLH
ncbi:hypothetical protein GN244_ATG15931 [Phytophthora infestans]|uniref:Uncharacterized protein n=1 Tax=Phytophthora infestans TaxID=4787 RepID=A0A833SBS7_PHYIN|nr:hypothetical protein GN244_ATG15931 [Phytophthora infestans]